MSVLGKLSRLMTGAAPADEAVAALTQCYSEAAVRAKSLAVHAEFAPQSGDKLRELAAEEERHVERLGAALRSSGAPLPPVSHSADPSHAVNFWGRIVRDLEAHRLATRRLRELAMRFADTLPATAQLFDELCREEMAHCDVLRNLIARADPQALN